MKTQLPEIKVQFRIVYFPLVDRYVGMAWNYNVAVLISTEPFATYAETRKELGLLAEGRKVILQWFDGDYICEEGGLLTTMTIPFKVSCA